MQNFNRTLSTQVRNLAILCSVVLVAACGESAEKQAVTQVAAKVDGTEISIHQVNAVLARANLPATSDVDALRKEVLNRLVDQQVVYQQAVEKKLDRDPKVMMLLDAAKKEILARAYMDALTSSSGKPSETEVHSYYVDNPSLFSRRRVFNLDQIAMPATPALRDALVRMAEDGSDSEAIGKFLTAKGIEYRNESGTRPAEQIPLDILPRLAAVPEGKGAVLESGNLYYVVHVVSSQSSPINESDARPRIQVFLSNQQGQRLVAEEMKRLRDKAHIEYMGNFAKAATQPDAVAALESERSAK